MTMSSYDLEQKGLCLIEIKSVYLGADHLTSEGGGGGGWVILKKNILQVHMHKKKILAQDHRAKKNSCTYSGLEKHSGKMSSELTH